MLLNVHEKYGLTPPHNLIGQAYMCNLVCFYVEYQQLEKQSAFRLLTEIWKLYNIAGAA